MIILSLLQQVCVSLVTEHTVRHKQYTNTFIFDALMALTMKKI